MISSTRDRSPYGTAIDNHPMLDKNQEPSIPSYTIDEYVDEDGPDERDHVKELEERSPICLVACRRRRHCRLRTSRRAKPPAPSSSVYSNRQVYPSATSTSIQFWKWKSNHHPPMSSTCNRRRRVGSVPSPLSRLPTCPSPCRHV